MSGSARKKDNKSLMSADEVAQQLSVSSGAVRQWVRTGTMKSVRAGKLIRISQAQVDEFLEASMRIAGGSGSQKTRDYTLSEIEEFVREDTLEPELAERIEKIINRRK